MANQESQIILASVPPVVVISAGGLLCMAFYNRLAAIVSRLRALHRERLQHQEEMETHRSAAAVDEARVERHHRILTNLDAQTQQLMRRARLLRATLLLLLSSIAMLVLSSIANGLTIFWPATTFAANVFFLCGMCLLLLGVMYAGAEMLGALSPAELESALIEEVTAETGQPWSTANQKASGIAPAPNLRRES
jgi:hypothetical protein